MRVSERSATFAPSRDVLKCQEALPRSDSDPIPTDLKAADARMVSAQDFRFPG